MFTWFNKNKFNYNKGQLAPVFIVVLAVLLIMALVSVNLSKVSFIKTDSSNAVDSGALAGGSVMANVFNGVASSNSAMEAFYWESYATISVAFIIALVSLDSASTQACGNPCGAFAAIQTFITTTWAIAIAVTAYHVAQNYFYLSIREMAIQGREQSIKIAHQFTFINSGIGSKLKEGEPDEEMDEQQRLNYRDEFSDYLDEDIGFATSYTYAWQDGQERLHSVASTVAVDEVDTYQLQVAALPFPAEIALLAISINLARISRSGYATACACEPNPCCAPPPPFTIFISMIAAWAGLLPGYAITASSASVSFIICWIDEIMHGGQPHNRRFRVDTDQHHEGADLGLWQTRYPDTHSYSSVDFTGRGEIHPPELRHDSSIVETDR